MIVANNNRECALIRLGANNEEPSLFFCIYLWGNREEEGGMSNTKAIVQLIRERRSCCVEELTKRRGLRTGNNIPSDNAIHEVF